MESTRVGACGGNPEAAAAGGYRPVLNKDVPTFSREFSWIPRSRWAWRAAGAALCAPLIAIALLVGHSSDQFMASTNKAREGLQGKVAMAPEAFTCAKYGCLDVRSLNTCQCSQHCLKEGNCCPDYQAVCVPAAVKARLGVWPGCTPPGPLQPPPGGWAYVPHGAPLQLKVLSYNPEWWHVIEQMGGNGNSIAKVIVQGSQPVPFDFIGFQEFYDPWYGLTRPGFDASHLLNEYMFVRGEFGGPVGTIIAFHNATWALLARGQRYVGEDRKGPVYFGKRIALWARFQHKQTGKTVFMMNHHGPLPTNTGGMCGSMTTALNLLHVIAENAKLGDVVIFVGDFNANIASVTVKQISMRLHRLFQGIDNIFINLPPSSVVRQFSLPSGGSDHAAITALLQLPGGAEAPAAAQVL